ncbi:hypothetical protein ACRALDRAFT_212503 [Sodiomyces alcalophilus JCM 7366]|uniref:uncharacterized protein n=1 Tax=Sodiomyces alcalophilus JCM 7366 TaxID=591952 RepID=UPI0039B6B9EF
MIKSWQCHFTSPTPFEAHFSVKIASSVSEDIQRTALHNVLHLGFQYVYYRILERYFVCHTPQRPDLKSHTKSPAKLDDSNSTPISIGLEAFNLSDRQYRTIRGSVVRDSDFLREPSRSRSNYFL